MSPYYMMDVSIIRLNWRSLTYRNISIRTADACGLIDFPASHLCPLSSPDLDILILYFYRKIGAFSPLLHGICPFMPKCSSNRAPIELPSSSTRVSNSFPSGRLRPAQGLWSSSYPSSLWLGVFFKLLVDLVEKQF